MAIHSDGVQQTAAEHAPPSQILKLVTGKWWVESGNDYFADLEINEDGQYKCKSGQVCDGLVCIVSEELRKINLKRTKDGANDHIFEVSADGQKMIGQCSQNSSKWVLVKGSLQNILQVKENETMRLQATAATSVKRAWYGHPNHKWEEGLGCGIVCTEIVIDQLRASDRIVATNDALNGDPCPGVSKLLLVEFVGPAPEPLVSKLGKFPHFERPEDVPSAPRWVAFVRHGEAGHNVDRKLLEHPDNGLTNAGKRQVAEAASGAAGAAVRSAQLVLTSPLKRAMQTTGLLLEGASPRPRVRIEALGTERRAATCDAGTLKSELMADLPPECSLDWEGWEELEEKWWPEPGEDMWSRAEDFVQLLQQHPEDRIVVVGHGAFTQMITGKYLKNCNVIYCNRNLDAHTGSERASGCGMM